MGVCFFRISDHAVLLGRPVGNLGPGVRIAAVVQIPDGSLRTVGDPTLGLRAFTKCDKLKRNLQSPGFLIQHCLLRSVLCWSISRTQIA